MGSERGRQSITHPADQPSTNSPRALPVGHPMYDPMDDPMDDPMSDPMKDDTSEATTTRVWPTVADDARREANPADGG